MELHALRKTAGLWWTKVFAATSGSLAKRGGRLPLFELNIQKTGQNRTIMLEKTGQMMFCKKKNIGEMDFVIEMNGKVVPIEVKSGKSYKAHKALDHFMKVPDYHLEKAYVFSVGNVEKAGSVMYLPVYMCYLLKEKQLGRMIVELDLDGL